MKGMIDLWTCCFTQCIQRKKEKQMEEEEEKGQERTTFERNNRPLSFFARLNILLPRL